MPARYRTPILVAILIAMPSFAAAQPEPAASGGFYAQIDALASQSEDIMKLVGTIASIAATAIGIVGGLLGMRKTRAEIAEIERRAGAAAAEAVSVPTLLTDPRLALALIIAMDFIVASVVTSLTRLALSFVTAPFGGTLGEWIYNLIQGLMVAIFFWPIVLKARHLRKMIADPGSS